MLLRVVLLTVALLPATLFAQTRSILAPVPDWSELEQYQQTITREEFKRLLDTVYAPGDAAREVVQVKDQTAEIVTRRQPLTQWTLKFAVPAESARAVPRVWRPAAPLEPASANTPLAGVRIAIDPGHLGGQWARMEERWFRIGESQPVMEGEMTLKVAELLEPRLRKLGAEVVLLRRTTEPVTPDRPETLREPARNELARNGVPAPREGYAGPEDPAKGGTVQWQSELLFYRISEIRRRAQIVNQEVKPDLTVCLHFNAEAWGDPLRPEFVPRNHFHVLINGCYSAAELRNDDVRFDMLQRLLSQVLPEELALSTTVSDAFGRHSTLPPYTYTTPNAVRIGSSAYVWARNLLANRLYRTPVLFMEPYVMNSQEVWERVQAGDYEGEREIGGQRRQSIYREYADGLAEGLKTYFESTRTVVR